TVSWIQVNSLLTKWWPTFTSDHKPSRFALRLIVLTFPVWSRTKVCSLVKTSQSCCNYFATALQMLNMTTHSILCGRSSNRSGLRNSKTNPADGAASDQESTALEASWN